MCTGLHKQISFELGEIYMEMLECKMGRIQEKIEAEPGKRPEDNLPRPCVSPSHLTMGLSCIHCSLSVSCLSSLPTEEG